ncbi:hypothetical protein HB364_11110 [Pseudoflavitalea sp. X16]|uniref:hypothetical protein n=1 Tax=Paraflavitalea devenefica TaxID=2716334 RepID=UPI00141FABFC|nr:hypothetical protein [Paraflavitalea devenefica]NII25635.1 hypothetical protein [Paraflavitalea devenefica]
MEKSRQEIIEITEKLLAMLPEVQDELRQRYPNVSSVEVGIKRRGGELTDVICFRVIVKKKVSEGDLAPQDVIPKEIRGVPTDVLIEYPDMNCDDTSGYDLLTGGIQIDIGIGNGTLGCFVTRDAEPAGSKKIYLLSNHHVIIGENGAVGTRVGQPSSPSGSNCCLCYDIATVFCGEVGSVGGTATTVGTVVTAPGSPNAIDAAIAKLLGQDATDPKTVHFANSIEEIGPVFGSSSPLVLHDRVRKRGRTTGLTFGQIEAVGVTSNPLKDSNNPSAGTTPYLNCTFLITPLAESPLMANGGDSGSVVVNSRNQVVGLIFAVPTTAGPEGTSIANGNAKAFPIQTVLTRLGISVLSSGTANSIPLSGIAEEKIKPLRAGSYIHAFERQLNTIPEGPVFMQMLLDHRNEVMDLINDNREVKVAWHRFNGPEYIGHILKNSAYPQHPVPPAINGYSLQNLLIKMSEVLERHGSRRLAKAVDDYSAFAFNFAHQYKGIDTLKDALSNFPVCPKCGKPFHLNTHAD